MGTVVAQDIFQSKLDAIFIGMEGVTGIADDMIIAGKDEMEHDRNFLAFMEKCMENNLTLNVEKIQFKQNQVSFYGHIWSDQGISPDPKKTQALKHMEFPPDKETMRSFLGMTKQEVLSQFSGCFEGIGHFPGDPYRFHLKPDHKPARHAPRKVPVHLKAAFKEEIDSLVRQGILEEVKEHTHWVN